VLVAGHATTWRKRVTTGRVIQQREKQGWSYYYGTTEDDKFLQFTMPTAEVKKRGL
jgi:hypothetical protein